MPETKLESRTPRAADTAQPQPKSHGLALKDRRHLAVTGVIRVISCDENAAVLETPLGNLTVGGQELQIGELSTQSGQVQLSGKIEYLQPAVRRQSAGAALSVNGPVARAVGRAGGCAVVLRARLSARGRAGCCAAGTRGGAGAVLFPGHSRVCRGGGARLRVCRRGQRGRSGPLVYECRRAAGGRQLAVGGAACRAPRGGNAGGAGVQTAAACTQNARQARTNALTSGPKSPPRLPQSKKIC